MESQNIFDFSQCIEDARQAQKLRKSENIERLQALLKPEKLNDFDRSFIETIKVAFENNKRLSAKQKEVLGKILLKCES